MRASIRDGVPRYLNGAGGADDVPHVPRSITEHAGLAPRGAAVEPGAQRGHPSGSRPCRASREPYAQAVAAQWSADRDTPVGHDRPAAGRDGSRGAAA